LQDDALEFPPWTAVFGLGFGQVSRFDGPISLFPMPYHVVHGVALSSHVPTLALIAFAGLRSEEPESAQLRQLLQSNVPPIGETPARLAASLSNLGPGGGQRKLSQIPNIAPAAEALVQPVVGRRLSQVTAAALAPAVEQIVGTGRKLSQIPNIAPAAEALVQPVVGRRLSQVTAAALAPAVEQIVGTGRKLSQETTLPTGTAGLAPSTEATYGMGR
jgi:hypothetical protein